MQRISSRYTYLLGFIIISILLASMAYLQNHGGLIPCPLCILQRITLGVLGLVFFLGTALNLKPTNRIIVNLLACVIAGLGSLFAGRQVWLQYFPPATNGDCGASLQYMLQAFPLKEVIAKVLLGGTECSQVPWQFLHASLAEWSLLCFVLFLLISFWQLGRTICRC